MFRRLFISLLALVGVALSGAVAGPGTAHAQGSDIDLAVSIALQNNVQNPTITVANYGSDNAYHVQIVMKVGGITLGSTLTSPTTGTVALHPTDSTTTLIWSIPRMLGNGIKYEYILNTASSTSITVIQYTATVFNDVFLEPEASRHNNHTEAWQIRLPSAETRTPTPDYAIEATVDNPFPQSQGSVTFTVVAKNEVTTGDAGHLSDAQVTISLPAGLTYTSHTAPTGTSYNSSTGIWTIGDWQLAAATHSLTLTATLAADAVLNKQCVTAELSAKPPEPIDKTVDNRSTVCLGENDEPVLFQSGEVDTFTIYPCVERTAYPCGSTDDVRVRVVDKTTPQERVLSPDMVFIHVQDVAGRIFDGHTNSGNVLQSVNSVTTISWQTSTEGSGSTAFTTGIHKGVKIAFSREEFDSTEISNWTRHSGERIVVKGAGGGSPPGSMHLRGSNSGNALSRMNSGNSYTATYNGSTSSTPRNAPSKWFAEFEKLGTYVVDYTTRAIHKTSTSPDCDFDNDGTNESFCDTQTYTFHVGPIAELGVRDAGPNPAVSSSQRAFTIVAANNGPDSAPAAQVTVNLQGANVSRATPSQGSYDYNPDTDTGIWTLGDFPGAAPTLTLITTAPADTPITATITNTQDYQVCIASNKKDLSHTTKATCEAVTGASWHTAKYYDYKSANNTATITAQAGTRSGSTANITVEWTAQTGAATYQVWRQGSPWKLIAEVSASETSYIDSTAEPGRAYLYMVRALDAEDIPVSSETLVAAAPVTVTVGGSGGSGGSTRPPPTDHHGNSPATATPLAPTARVGGFLHSGDQDYFRLVLPHTGLLYVETTGWSNTVGTVWQGGVELGSAELGGRLYNFKLGVPVQPGPVVIRVTERSPTAFGTYRLYTRYLPGSIDQPRPITVQNGLGMLTGWLCSADPVVLEIDGQPYHPAPLPAPVPPPSPHVVGTGGSGLPPRAVDPHELCDDTATGFGLPVNWNLLGDGQHTLIAYLNGLEFARTVVDVATLGEEFVHDAHGTCSVPNFPLPDHSVSLVWQEAGQHFALSDGQPPPPVGATRASDVLGRLETPAPGSFQSGRGVISGWVCDAEAVSIEIDGEPYPVAYGTARADTAAVCENPAPGFGLSLDWNRLGPGDHEVVALADGAEFGRATVRVTTLGAAFVKGADKAFVRGLDGECVVDDFPAPGEAVHLEWQETTQNFVITAVE